MELTLHKLNELINTWKCHTSEAHSDRNHNTVVQCQNNDN